MVPSYVLLIVINDGAAQRASASAAVGHLPLKCIHPRTPLGSNALHAVSPPLLLTCPRPGGVVDV